jgi:hypothetical protein
MSADAAAFVDAASKNEFLSSRFFSTELFMNWPNNFEMQFFCREKQQKHGTDSRQFISFIT